MHFVRRGQDGSLERVVMATIIKGKNKNRPYTVRYFHEGRQRERSFRTSREANDFKIKFEHDNREQIFVDPAKANEPFRLVAARWLGNNQSRPRTKEIYEVLLRRHINPALGNKTLLSVSRDREQAFRFLTVTMPANGAGPTWCRSAYTVICAVINYAVRSGAIPRNQIAGLTLPKAAVHDFVLPTTGQVIKLANGMPEPYGLSVYVMRGCGLRISEALAVERQNFRRDGLSLAFCEQMSPDGTERIPLKHRNAGEVRTVPVPPYVWDQVQDLGSGPICPPVRRRNYMDWFNRAKAQAGIEGHFTPHSLRHAFASVCLAQGVPITDVSHWLGHQSIQTTFGIYGHLVSDSFERGRAALNEEWSA